MKKLVATLFLVAIVVSVQAQSKVREKDILGEWDLVIDLDEVKDEIDEELDDEDFWLARSFARGISDFAIGIVESINISFDFREDGEVKIRINVFGERETEYADWYINRDGELIIEDDHRRRRSRKNFSMSYSDDRDVWMLKNGKLQAYEKTRRGRLEEKTEVYLKKR